MTLLDSFEPAVPRGWISHDHALRTVDVQRDGTIQVIDPVAGCLACNTIGH